MMNARSLTFAVAAAVLLEAGCASGTSGTSPLPASTTVGSPMQSGTQIFPEVPDAFASGTVNWPNVGMNAGLNGSNASERTLSKTNVATLQQLWSNGGPDVQGVSAMAAGGGKIFVQSGAYTNVPDLTALNEQTGSVLWTASTSVLPQGLPGIATGDGLVFDACYVKGNSQQEGLCAFGAATGKLVWSYVDSCNCLPASGIDSPATYANGTVYFGYHFGSTGQNGMFIAANAKTGGVLWTVGCNSSCGLTVAGTAVAVGNGAVYAGCSLRPSFTGLCAYNATSGTQLWTYAGISEASAPAVAGGTVYVNQVGGQQQVSALNSSGTQLWTTPLPCCASGTAWPPAVAGGRVFVLAANNELVALNAASGKQLWSLSPSCGGFDSSPSIANGVLYIVPGPHCSDAEAINPANGSMLWQASTGGRGFGAPPMIMNGVLYSQCWVVCAYGLPAASKGTRL